MIWYIVAALCWLLVAGSLAERMFVTNNRSALVISLLLIAAAWFVTMPVFAIVTLWANQKRDIPFPPPFADAMTPEGLERLRKALEEQ